MLIFANPIFPLNSMIYPQPMLVSEKKKPGNINIFCNKRGQPIGDTIKMDIFGAWLRNCMI